VEPKFKKPCQVRFSSYQDCIPNVEFTAGAAGNHTAHLFWVSFDNQVTWVFLDASFWKKMVRSGFTTGAVLWFDHQVVNTAGRQALDGPKKLQIG